MHFLSNEKLVIVGAAGRIGSNMAQIAMLMHLTPEICLYDPYAPALEGVAEELGACAVEGINLTYTSDIALALKDARYIVNSGGARRVEGMTCEDLIRDNTLIAEQFGKDVRRYCPDVCQVVVLFNPSDITGLITLIYSGLKPSQVSVPAAVDSTRLRHELAKWFKVRPDKVINPRIYGAHGEEMAVFASAATVDGHRLTDLIGTEQLPVTDWEALLRRVVQGGKHIAELRDRSSFQSPAYLSIEMIAAAMGGKPFPWPVGVYVDNDRFRHIMMAMETTLDESGVHVLPVEGTPAEQADLDRSYRHLCRLRDRMIALGFLPPIDTWHSINPNL